MSEHVTGTGRKIPNYDFLGKAKLCGVFSIFLLAWCVYVFFSTGNEKYGVDFTGGHDITVRAADGTSSDKIRSALGRNGIENAIVQHFDGTEDYSVRLEGTAAEADSLKERLSTVLAAELGSPVEVKKSEFVGPTIGEELKWKALVAIAISLVAILGYIAFRFEFAFALGAIVALFHDVVIGTGIYLATGHTLSMGALAAALTIMGYSVNDTIVIFDRIREEIHHARGKYNLVDVMNRSINAMLSRTLITHLLTLFSAIALVIFGGGAIRDLSVYLLVGIISGVYSTIYIACPVVLAWHKFRGGSIEQE